MPSEREIEDLHQLLLVAQYELSKIRARVIDTVALRKLVYHVLPDLHDQLERENVRDDRRRPDGALHQAGHQQAPPSST